MVCPRCISAVTQILAELNVAYKAVKLGEVDMVSILNESDKEKISNKLQDAGFSLIDDRKSQFIEQIKTLVVDKIHHSSEELHIKWAD